MNQTRNLLNSTVYTGIRITFITYLSIYIITSALLPNYLYQEKAVQEHCEKIEEKSEKSELFYHEVSCISQEEVDTTFDFENVDMLLLSKYQHEIPIPPPKFSEHFRGNCPI